MRPNILSQLAKQKYASEPTLKIESDPLLNEGPSGDYYGDTSPDFGNSKYDTQTSTALLTKQNELNYLRGERQTRLDKLANAVPRLISKIGTEVLKTPGYIYALGKAAVTDTTLAKSMNNAWLDGLQAIDDKTKEEFAIYKPKSVREGNLWDNISSTSFWTDEGIDGAGYLISMMAPGAAMKAAGLAGGFAKLGATAAWAQKLELGTATMLNTTLESMAEAKGGVDALKSEFKGKIGRGELNPKTGNLWTQEEADVAINDAGKGIFMTNMALLSAPNYLMNKALLGRFVATKSAINKTMDVTGKLIDIAPLTRKALLKEYASKIGTGIVSEGFVEEAGQFSLENYYKKLAKHETDKDLMAGFAEEYGNALTTTEGQKSIFLGAFFGATAIGSTGRELKQEHTHVTKLSKMLKENFKGFSDKLDNLYEKDESTGKIKLDNNDQPIVNQKVAAEYAAQIALESKSSNLKDFYALVGNKEAHDFIAGQEFAKFAMSYLNEEGGIEALDKHIDLLSEKLIANKKAQEGIDVTVDEHQYKFELKQKARELKKSFDQVDGFINNIDLEYAPENTKHYNSFISNLINATFQETSKQMFLIDRIQKITTEINHLEIGTASALPQVQSEIQKLKNQLVDHQSSLDNSIETYKEIFDKNKVADTFNSYVKEQLLNDENIQKNIEVINKTKTEEPVITQPTNNNNESVENTEESNTFSDQDLSEFGLDEKNQESDNQDINTLISEQEDPRIVDIEKRRQEDFNNENESYRVIVGDEAFNDIIESGAVRTNAETKTKKEGGIDLSSRPTAYPSFSKGKASMEYAAENPNNYIIVTEDSSIQPSKVGRHGKGTTMFPTDENGNHLKELSGEKIKVYKHIGNGEYILVYANGEQINTDSNTLKQSVLVSTNTDDVSEDLSNNASSGITGNEQTTQSPNEKQKGFLTFAFGGVAHYSGQDLRIAHEPLVRRG